MSARKWQQAKGPAAALTSSAALTWPWPSSVNEFIVANSAGTISADDHHKKRSVSIADSYVLRCDDRGAKRALDDRFRPNPHSQPCHRAG